MNVEVLGDDTELLGGVHFPKILKKAVGFTPQALAYKAVKKSVKHFRGFYGETQSTVPQAVYNATVTTVKSLMTPTDKALLAESQIKAGIPPNAISGVSQTPILIPGTSIDIRKHIPETIIFGAVLVGGIIMLATQKSRYA